MDEYDNFYTDDTAQGAEGGFYGYDSDKYQDPLDTAGQNTDYSFFDNNDFQNLDFNERYGGNLFNTSFGQNLDFNERTFPQMTSQPNPLPMNESQGNIPFGDMLTKILGGLGGLFQPQNQKKTSSILGALLEGYQNKQNASSTRNIIQQQQQQADPFGSQRPYYQQQLQQAVSNPYGAKIVQDQITALKRAQDIKNAAAGRRSNSATTDPELARAMADIALKYQQSLYQPAGAGISPNMIGTQGLIDANKQNTQGFISPLLSALGYNTGGNMNQENTDQALANFVKIMSTINKGN